MSLQSILSKLHSAETSRRATVRTRPTALSGDRQRNPCPSDHRVRTCRLNSRMSAMQELAALRESHSEEPCDVLPLYALDYVLPGQSIALNMFEPRYRLMTRRCMDGDRKFGMLGVTPDPVHIPGVPARRRRNLGTEVEIIESKQLFDGRCHIQVRALQRFEIMSTKETDGYRCANVRFYKDEPAHDKTASHAPFQRTDPALQEVR